jgi:predicted anti-sigma-YlaC factor YlaD
MELDSDHLKQLVCALLSERQDALECEACFEQMGCFVELELAGKSAAELLPLVEQHLACCEECREEYQALREALSALD